MSGNGKSSAFLLLIGIEAGIARDYFGASVGKALLLDLRQNIAQSVWALPLEALA
jgi:hypothetical protein